ncbi:MAG TPA: ABC transporter permease [Thermoanaerobaculia bacterium]
MNFLSQLSALTVFNLKTIPRRKGSAIAAAAGIAGVVAVLVGVLSIREGFREAMVAAGDEDRAMVLRSGSDTEMMSILFRNDLRAVESAPAVAKKGGRALVSPELFVVVSLPLRSTGGDANVPLRGIEPTALDVRSDVKIAEGRMFGWGKNEVIVGRGAAHAFRGIDLGSTIKLGSMEWSVVGVFEAEGGISESEIWADAAVLAPAYQRGETFQLLLVRLASAGSFQQFKDALTSDPRLNVRVVREPEFYAEQSRLIQMIITGLGTIVSLMMGFGALFGALNTMYTAVASRTREIGTLKAVGFGSGAVIISIVLESLLLALAGGAAGAAIAFLAFDGFRAATMNWQSFSQVAFAFDVNAPLLVRGILYAAVIGVLGGLFPAIRAARMPVANALRG